MTTKATPGPEDASFYVVEAAMLDAIAAQYLTQRDELLAQFQAAHVTGRCNTGAGFFTEFEVDRQKAAAITLPRVIGNVSARIDGLKDAMTFLVFIDNGYAKTLEGAAITDGTKNVDFRQVKFRLQA